MKKLLASILPAMALGLAAPTADAADNVVVVELFTSQGCSSCPPADKNLGLLTERDDVLPLSMHVDYWDYLGWRDTFAQKAHTQRQIGYRDLMGARVIYTPQMIVHGTRDVPGYRSDLLDNAIAEQRAIAAPTQISIVSDGGMLKAQLAGVDESRPCTIWMASYSKSQTVKIGRGENAGETITYHNVVDKLMRVGQWDGSAAEIALPQPSDGEGVAIWLQDDQTGRILTASFIEE